MYSKTQLREGLWSGRRCFVLGSGPSMKVFDYSQLKGELVIGINRSFKEFEPSILLSMDKQFYQWEMWGKYGPDERQRFLDLICEKVLVRNGAVDSGFFGEMTLIKRAGMKEVSKSLSDGLTTGSNSGTCALGLAILLGANPIYLLGFDMKDAEDGSTHCHNGHPNKPKCAKGDNYKRFLRHLKNYAPQMKKMSNIINLNPDSALRDFQFGIFEGIKLKTRPTVVGFYTNDAYHREALGMAHSAKLFGLEVKLYEMPDKLDWVKNCAQKCQVLERALNEIDGPILYLDADARVREYPEFDFVDGHTGVCYVDWTKVPGSKRNHTELLSGTIYLTQESRPILKDWKRKLEDNPRAWDQQMLQRVVDGREGVFSLPLSYCQIFDSMKSIGSPVIEQLQASRTHKKGLMATREGDTSGRKRHIMITGFCKSGTGILGNMISYAYPNLIMPPNNQTSAIEMAEIDEDTISSRPEDLLNIVDTVKALKYAGKDTYVICLVRDIRDILSQVGNIVADDLRAYYDKMYLLGHMKGPHRLFITYEQLVKDPGMVRELLSSFLRTEPSRDWVEFWREPIRHIDKGSRGALKASQAALISNWAGHWKEMDHREVVLSTFGESFDLRKMLIELGYEDNDQWYHAMADAYFEEKEAATL